MAWGTGQWKGTGGSVSVPYVVGETETDAAALIVAAGLVVGTSVDASSTTVAIDGVISQDPVAGVSAAVGSAVDLTISLGTVVPDTVGGSSTDGSALIVAAGLVVGAGSTSSSTTVAIDDVISQDPTFPNYAEPGSDVDMVVSLGAVVPDVVDEAEATADSAIVAAGLIVGTDSEANSGVIAVGNVISQDPTFPNYAEPGSAVDLTISIGLPPVVSGSAAWWKADSLSLNDDDPVTSWTSSEGNAYEMTATTLAPTFKTGLQNGLPGVRFNGDFIQAANVGTNHSSLYFTVFLVGTAAASAKQVIFGAVDDPAQDTPDWQTDLGIVVGFYTDEDPVHQPYLLCEGSTNYSDSAGGLAVYIVTRDGTGVSIAMYRNNTQQTMAKVAQEFNTHQTDLDSFRFGAKGPSLVYPYVGDLFELLFYESVLSTADREANVAYLMAKWGLT